MNCLGKTLLIPQKEDIEREKVTKAWEEYGGVVKRLDRFWEYEKDENEEISLYGNHIFCMILAQKLNLELVSPPDDFLAHLSHKWVKRNIFIRNLDEARNISYPCFVKPLIPKIFTSKIYASFTELQNECRQLEGCTKLILSDIMNLSYEMRFFIFKSRICASSIYEGSGNINYGKAFLEEFIIQNHHLLPKTCVIDVGFVNNRDFAIIEANPVWGAGLNGCDAFKAIECILNATIAL